MRDRQAFKPTIFKKPRSVEIENLTNGAMVLVVDSKGWTHTFYAYADSVSLVEWTDISRKIKKGESP